MAASKQTSGAKNKTAPKSAANKSSTSKKKPNSSSAAKSKQNKNDTQFAADRQKWAIGLMAGAVLLICITLIEGESLWKGLHSGLFAFFGTSAYVLPVLLIYVAIIFSKNRSFGSITSNLILVGSFILLLSSAIHIFSNPPDYLSTENLWLQMTTSFWAMDDMPNSGFFGAFIGGLLSKMAGKVGAGIINVVALIVILMFLTGTTLTMIYTLVSTNISRMKAGTTEAITKSLDRYQEHEVKKENDEKSNEDNAPTPKIEINQKPQKNPDYTFPWEIPIDDYKDKEEKNYNGNPDFNPDSKSIITTQDGVKVNELGEVIEENIEPEEREDIELPPVTVPKTDGRAALAVEVNKRMKKSISNYRFPNIDCLNLPKPDKNENYIEELQTNAKNLIDTLESFKISAKITAISRGPSVTRYEFLPAPGVRINTITNLSDNIAMNLAATSIRMEAPIPGKAAIGLEVPNIERSTVTMRELVASREFKNAKSKLTVALGKDITGNIICADIEKMPHLLIAGTTGSGKSVCINSMIISLLYNATPDEVKLLLIDPKLVEFKVYNGIAHLAVPVVNDAKKASGALSWAVSEMERRYQVFAELGVRDIKDYNNLAESDETIEKMPRVVIFIDELADLMMVAPAEVEDSICRLAQKARAAGMHLVVATQRPSVDVITGLIKANIPSRIALYVSSSVDSRTIIDKSGAEKLLGNGDMLFSPVGAHNLIRIQGCFVSSSEVKKVVDFIKQQAECEYDEEIISQIEKAAKAVEINGSKRSSNNSDDDEDDHEILDPLFEDAVDLVLETENASTSFLQRKLSVGYARAGRIMDQLESNHIVGPLIGSKPRKILITRQQWLERCATMQEPQDESIDE